MVPIPPELQKLADSLAELKVHASVAAQSQINVMVLDLLIRKGVITPAELLQRLNDIETNAATSRALAPTTADAVLALTLGLRNAFSPGGGSSKPS